MPPPPSEEKPLKIVWFQKMLSGEFLDQEREQVKPWEQNISKIAKI